MTVEDQDNLEQITYRLVGSDEIDASQHWISIDSPMARALVGKSVDDEVKVKTPSGERYLVVTEIRY